MGNCHINRIHVWHALFVIAPKRLKLRDAFRFNLPPGEVWAAYLIRNKVVSLSCE